MWNVKKEGFYFDNINAKAEQKNLKASQMENHLKFFIYFFHTL